MYAYRTMTEAERLAVVSQRIERGYPWHKPPHPDLGTGWYFITGATFEHQLHFTRPDELTALQRRLFQAFAEAETECGGWVVMPNHYHALLHVQKMPALGKALGRVHGRSSCYANERDNTPRRQVWFKFSDRKIRSERHYWTCLHYIILNPVKHGFTTDPFHWPWSCIHELLAAHGREWIEDLQREYPLRDFGRRWDEWHVGRP